MTSRLFEGILSASENDLKPGEVLLYHRTDENIYHTYFFNRQLEFGKKVGLLDAAGIYTTYNVKDQLNKRMISLYGKYIYSLKTPTDNLLYFDYDALVSQTTWGRDLTRSNFIEAQKERYGLLEEQSPTNLYLTKKYSSDEIDFDKKVNVKFNWLTSKYVNECGSNTADAAHKFSALMMKIYKTEFDGQTAPCSGIVFTGRLDGQVAVIWQSYICIPYKYSLCPIPGVGPILWKSVKKDMPEDHELYVNEVSNAEGKLKSSLERVKSAVDKAQEHTSGDEKLEKKTKSLAQSLFKATPTIQKLLDSGEISLSTEKNRLTFNVSKSALQINKISEPTYQIIGENSHLMINDSYDLAALTRAKKITLKSRWLNITRKPTLEAKTLNLHVSAGVLETINSRVKIVADEIDICPYYSLGSDDTKFKTVADKFREDHPDSRVRVYEDPTKKKLIESSLFDRIMHSL
jgi:hypothetical protein